MEGDLIGENSMLAWLLAGAGLLFIWLASRGGFLPRRKGSVDATWDPPGIFLAVVSVAVSVWWFGLAGGISVVLAVVWHEYGHTIAYRCAGHDDAKFRLIPFFGGVAMSRGKARSHTEECYVALMGPGFSLALVAILAIALWQLDAAGNPMARYAYLALSMTGFLNAFNMLPLWPLDGGRAIRAMTVSFAPGLARVLTIAMSGLLLVYAFLSGAWFLLILAIMGIGWAQQIADHADRLPPMPPVHAFLGAVAYGTIFGTHILAGAGMIIYLLPL